MKMKYSVEVRSRNHALVSVTPYIFTIHEAGGIVAMYEGAIARAGAEDGDTGTWSAAIVGQEQ